MDIIGKKKIYFLISLILIIPGLISLVTHGLRLSIDFTGGSRLEYQFDAKHKVQPGSLETLVEKQGTEVYSIQKSGENRYLVRTKPLEQSVHEKIKKTLEKTYAGAKELAFETVGPVVGAEVTANAFKAVVVASLLIVLYIAWAFRKVPKPASSIRFGICTVVALLHDVLVVVGVFSIFGAVWHVEIDSLFVTAVLTVIGFSVHDTIVVFDRIRENLRRMPTAPFAEVVNESIKQTLVRSLNTSLTVLIVLIALLLFGGESIKWFVVALIIGIASGTFSSIFNAAPLLVVWEEWSRKRKV